MRPHNEQILLYKRLEKNDFFFADLVVFRSIDNVSEDRIKCMVKGAYQRDVFYLCMAMKTITKVF